MAKARTAVGVSMSLLLMLLATIAAQGNLSESALTTAVVPVKPEKIDASGVASAYDLTSSAAGKLYVHGQPTFRKLRPIPPEFIDEETLWLARCIFSETKRPQEQELVAWVVRNRVETEYRGKSTYHEVVLDPMQFSAFNQGNPKRTYYTSLTPASRVVGWQTALRIAHEVRWGNADQWRPFSSNTRHFYSEQSMIGKQHPEWAYGVRPVAPEREYAVEAHRFRFFEGVN